METNAAPNGAPSTRFRWLILLTTLATYALIVVGGVVRTTESGDACPDWPTCHGQLIPPFDANVLIEFSHRLMASLVSFLVVATAIAAWRTQRRAPVIVWGATLSVALVAGQVVLGGVTVLTDLKASMVTAHLALASALLATLVALTVLSFTAARGDAARRENSLPFRNLAAIVALATLGLMLTGSYVAGAGASLAFRDWPLFDGKLWPEGGKLAMAHATHRFVAAAVGVLIAYLAVQAWKLRQQNGVIATGALIAAIIYIAQVFVGAANIWTLLQPSAAAAHLALAEALWATLVAITFLAHETAQPASIWSRAAAPAAASPKRRGTVEAPRALSGGSS